jgi:rod shape-determining protein MreB
LACAPTDASEKERRYLAEAIIQAGASHVAIIPEVWAAALGAGINVDLPHAQALIDIGEGVTDMAVIRDGRVIFASAVRIACSDLQKAIRTAMISKHRIYLFPSETERLTHELSSLNNGSENNKMIRVAGIDIVKKCRTAVDVSSREIVHAMEPVVKQILSMIGLGLQKLPDNISAEILETGLCLTGGGSCIRGMDRLISSRTNLNARVGCDPTHSVINGAIKMLNHWKDKNCWWEQIIWPKSLLN